MPRRPAPALARLVGALGLAGVLVFGAVFALGAALALAGAFGFAAGGGEATLAVGAAGVGLAGGGLGGADGPLSLLPNRPAYQAIYLLEEGENQQADGENNEPEEIGKG